MSMQCAIVMAVATSTQHAGGRRQMCADWGESPRCRVFGGRHYRADIEAKLKGDLDAEVNQERQDEEVPA
jgi:hypothetical protein